jgi:hypothetical protein
MPIEKPEFTRLEGGFHPQITVVLSLEGRECIPGRKVPELLSLT